jgi:AcrR family transcriptional regulator
MPSVPTSDDTRPPDSETAVPTRQRRKEARPGEIIEAAIAVFAEKGFAAARMEEVARRAGVSKATIFVYFPTKEDLFRGAARAILDVNIERLRDVTAPPDVPIELFVPALLQQAATVASEGRLPALLKLLMAEATTFPDLAQVWYDEVLSKVLGLIVTAIERAQARGQVRPCDPRLLAFSIMGPMLAGVLFRQMFSGTTTPMPDLKALAEQHAKVVLYGLTAP